MNRHGVLRSRNRPGRFRRRPWRGRPYQWPCDRRLAVASGRLPAGVLSDLQLFGTKDLYAWRRGEDFAEVAHPVMRVFGCTDTPAAKLIELIKVRLDFELQSRAASMGPRQWNQITAVVSRRLELPPNVVQPLLAVRGHHIVRKPRYIHDQTFPAFTHSNVVSGD